MTLSKPFVAKMCVTSFCINIPPLYLRPSDFAVRAELTEEGAGAFQPETSDNRFRWQVSDQVKCLVNL